MYETTISVPAENKYLLEYIKRNVYPAIAEIDGIATGADDKHRSYFSVACSDTFRFQLKRLLTENVSAALALGYKNLFVRKCLKVGKGNFFQNVLINTMCVFDKGYDQQLISKILEVDKPICIDGYFNFKLKLLKNKWKEIAKLVSDNFFILQDNKMMMEFLQYLLDSVDSKVAKLTLTLEEKEFLMYDSKNNLLPNVTTLAPSPSVEEDAAVNVLLLKPQHVAVYCKNTPSEDFCSLLQLFDCTLKKVN